MPKGAQITALSTNIGRDDVAASSQAEPLSAGVHMSANPLRGLGASAGEPKTEEKNSGK